ncbi:MAG: zinc ribbon domain-containing protein, partial [Lachnospiraceae bacterium]|nr:zinc ribbon domain-containing protein [Lachnospiraceae bacterium]
GNGTGRTYTMAFCQQCGSQLPDGAPFCTNCGAAQGSAPAQGMAPAAAGSGGSKKGLIIGLSVGGVLLAAGLVVLILFLAGVLGSKDEQHALIDPPPPGMEAKMPEGLANEYFCIFIGGDYAPHREGYNIVFEFGTDGLNGNVTGVYREGYLHTDTYSGSFDWEESGEGELTLYTDDGDAWQCYYHDNGTLDLTTDQGLYTFATADSADYAQYLEDATTGGTEPEAPTQAEIYGEWVAPSGVYFVIKEDLSYEFFGEGGVPLTYGTLNGTPGGPGVLAFNASNDRGGAPMMIAFRYGPGNYVEMVSDDGTIYSKSLMNGGGPEDEDRSGFVVSDAVFLGEFNSTDPEFNASILIKEGPVHAGGYYVWVYLQNSEKPEGEIFEGYGYPVAVPESDAGYDLYLENLFGPDGFYIDAVVSGGDQSTLELFISYVEHPLFQEFEFETIPVDWPER